MTPLTYLFAGASSSMAKETCILLRKKGHQVIGLSRTELDAPYHKIYPVKTYTPSEYPLLDMPIDGLVYFSGTINLKPFGRLSPEDFTKDFEINALGAATFIQAYISNLKRAGKSSIVLLSSVAARTGIPFHASIAMAKAAVEGLVKALAAELAPSVRVNCIAPALVDTPLALKLIDTAEKMEQMKKRNPLRQVGEATDIGNMISFLLSEEAGWITGQVIAVDGGMNSLKN